MDRNPQVTRNAWQEAVHRVGQFWQGLRAHITPQERAMAAALLGPDAMPLFVAMPADAQRHSLNVLALVREAGYQQPDLLQAALLHDVGKCAAAESGVGLSLWVRGPLVMLDLLFPQAAARWANDNPAQPWRYLLYVHRNHPAIGAQWAADAGCSPLCCWLIAQHQIMPDALPATTPHDGRRELLMALQAADAVD